MREKRRSLLESQSAGLSPDYVLAQIESAGDALDFSSDLLDFDRFTADTLRDRLLAQLDDTGAFSRVQKFCKSSSSTVRELIESHGPHAIVCNLLTLALARRYSPDALTELSREALDQWIRLLSVACAARRIAALRGCPTEVMHRAYAGAMLHEIGIFVLMEGFPRAYRRVLDRSRVAQQSIAASEVELLGADHHVIGRRTLLRWSMPEWIVDAAWLHPRPIESIGADRDIELIAHVQLAAICARARHDRTPTAALLPPECAVLCARLGVDASAVMAALDGLDREVADLVERLQLDPVRGANELPTLRRSYADLEFKLAETEHESELLMQSAERANDCVHFLTDRDETDVAATLRDSTEFLRSAFVGRPFAIVIAQPPSPLVRFAHSEEQSAAGVVRVGPDVIEAIQQHWNSKSTQPIPVSILDALGDLPPPLRDAHDWVWLGRQPRIGLVLVRAAEGARANTAYTQIRTVGTALSRALERERNWNAVEQVAPSLPAESVNFAEVGRISEIIAELAGGAAHELNNPLSVISGRAQMLKAEPLRPDMQHALEQIETKALECSQIIRDLMEFARPPAPSPTIVGVGELIDEALATWSRSARLSSAWTRNLGCTDSDAASHSIDVDRKQMRSALVELLRNAEVAIRDNEGLIDISWRRDPYDRRYLLIEVHDTGRGMTPEVARRAFDPFYSHRPAGRGRGLGLARAQRSVTTAGGTLTLESAPGIGTTARIRLPLHIAAE